MKSRHLSYIMPLILVLIGLYGCTSTKSEESNPSSDIQSVELKSERSASDSLSEEPGKHFKSHFDDAKRWGDLILRGIELRKSEKYSDALEVFKKALNEHAAMRNEQAAASKEIAITLEEMEKYQEAAKYYDLASEATLNEPNAEKYSRKAMEMRAKAQ